MNLKSHSTFKILFFTIYLLIGILLSLSKNTQYLSTEYNFILTAYFITGGAWGLCIYKKNIYIFEPATIVLGLTIITYAVAPLISINTNDLTINGFYVFDGWATQGYPPSPQARFHLIHTCFKCIRTPIRLPA